MKILYSRKFAKEYKKLSNHVKDLAEEKQKTPR